MGTGGFHRLVGTNDMIGTKRNGFIRKVFFSEIDFYFFEKEEHSCDEVARIDYTYSVLRPFISLNVLWNRYCSGVRGGVRLVE